MLGLTAEQDLVIRCVRAAFGQQVAAQGGDVPIHWGRFAELADQQGLAPLIFVGLRSLGLVVPADVAGQLHAWHAQSLLRTRVGLEPHLTKSLRALEERGLQPVVLKGAALAYTAYLKPHHRTLADLDLLVSEDELGTADEALRGAGYQVIDVELGHGHQHLPPYMSPDGVLAIELHHHIITEQNPYRVNLDAVLARAQQRRLAGVDARVFAPTDALLHVCLHLTFGHRYDWYSLRTLVDILALTTSSLADVDWDLLVETVRASRTAGAVYWPLRLSRDLLGAPVPAMVLEQLAPGWPLRRLAELVLDSPYALDGQVPSGAGVRVLHDVVREVSLYSGCPTPYQIGALWRGFFPSPESVTHLSRATTDSRIRYLANLTHPLRLMRGLIAIARLLARLPQST